MTISATVDIMMWVMSMPRQARRKSENETYHIMMRGINRQQIFEDEQDNEKFLQIIKEYREISGYRVFAYCLMGNHIHLLMKFDKEPIEMAMKRICGRFVYWYNTKYGRVGHLFQDRFKSEPIDDDDYFVACLRYIHQNPEKAGICRTDQYKYSSYGSYLAIEADGIIDTSVLYSIIPEDQYKLLNEKTEEKAFLDIPDRKRDRLTDEEAGRLIYRVCRCNNVSEFQALDRKQRLKHIKSIKQKGVGTRQICRLTGESYYIVQKS